MVTWGVLLAMGAPSAYAATAFWIEPGIVVQADAAITPADMTGATPDAFEPDGNLDSALLLPVDSAPVDRVVVAGDQDHFMLLAADGPGYIRIGTTAPIDINQGTGDSADNAISMTDFEPQSEGVDLLEMSLTAATELAANQGVERAYVRVTTRSKTPVAYRISFVRELPESRVGGAYGPGVLAQEYLHAVTSGDLTAIYRATRSHMTTDAVTDLRHELFGTRSVFEYGLTTHWADPNPDVDALSGLPVQRIILSDEDSAREGRHWAFVVKCEQRDGVWLVADVKRDPDLSEEDVARIVQRDFDVADTQTGAPMSAVAARLLSGGPIALGLVLATGLLVFAGLAILVFARGRKR
jgi:hypothetical protein